MLQNKVTPVSENTCLNSNGKNKAILETRLKVGGSVTKYCFNYKANALYTKLLRRRQKVDPAWKRYPGLQRRYFLFILRAVNTR